MYRRFVILVSVVLAAMFVAACAGSDEDEPPASVATTAAGEPTEAPAEDAYIIYRESSGNLVAQHVETGKKYHYEIDFNNEVIIALQCVPDGSKIAFLKQAFDRTDRQLIIRGEGAPAEPLSLPSSTQSIAWSPDGTQMAVSEYDGFTQEYILSTLDVATAERTVLAEGNDFVGSVGWSPDGERLVYYVQPITDRGAQVFVLTLDGGEPLQITSGEISWYDPVWAPDGSKIVVAGLQDDNFQLFALNPDINEEAFQLTDSDIFKRQPQFSPGGTLIGYTGSVVVPAVSTVRSGLHSFGIFLLNPDGSNERAFTADPRLSPGAQVDPNLDAYLMAFCKSGPWLDDLWVPEQ